MPEDHFLQRDWPPACFAVGLLVMAAFIVISMCVMLFFATKSQQPHHVPPPEPADEERPQLGAGTGRGDAELP